MVSLTQSLSSSLEQLIHALRNNNEVQSDQAGEGGDVAAGVWSAVINDNDNVAKCAVFTSQELESLHGKQVKENRGRECMPWVGLVYLWVFIFHISSAIREKI